MSNVVSMSHRNTTEPEFISRLRHEIHGKDEYSSESIGKLDDWRALAEFVAACHHVDDEIRTVFHSDGSRHYRKQCVHCGVPRSVFLPRGIVERSRNPKDIPLFDKDLQRMAAVAEWRWKSWGVEEGLRDAEAERQQIYDDYLQSPQWRELRARVMDRAQGLCEGCRQRPAREVHHLSYQNFQNEFLWELVAICCDCHRRAHKDKFQDMDIGS